MPEQFRPDTASTPTLPPAAEFRERLLPGPGAWLVFVALGAMFGVILVPLSPVAAASVGVLGPIVTCALVFRFSPVLEVREGQFRMGRARIAAELLGEATVLEGEQWKRTMGQDFEPTAHHCTRGWLHAGVRVPVLDEQDPTTAWVASSRRPEDLALALTAARRTIS